MVPDSACCPGCIRFDPSTSETQIHDVSHDATTHEKHRARRQNFEVAPTVITLFKGTTLREPEYERLFLLNWEYGVKTTFPNVDFHKAVPVSSSYLTRTANLRPQSPAGQKREQQSQNALLQISSRHSCWFESGEGRGRGRSRQHRTNSPSVFC